MHVSGYIISLFKFFSRSITQVMKVLGKYTL